MSLGRGPESNDVESFGYRGVYDEIPHGWCARPRLYGEAAAEDAEGVAANSRRHSRCGSKAEEAFSYSMPAFRFNGRILMWYAGWKAHVSMYPLTPAIRRAHAVYLARYETSKGTTNSRSRHRCRCRS